MDISGFTRSRLIASLPDVPEWSLTRFILSGGGDVVSDSTGAVAMNEARDFLTVIGLPSQETVSRAVAMADEEATLLAQPDAVEIVRSATGVPGERGDLHTLGDDASAIAAIADVTVNGFRDGDLNGLDLDLVEELEDAQERGAPISVARTNRGEAVAFCYSVGESERYWDVSIDAHPAHRRKGFATAAFMHHYGMMKKRGLEPVWGSISHNVASQKMAEKLGFRKVAEIWEFELGPGD